MTTTTKTGSPASEKQLAFIATLLQDREIPAGWAQFCTPEATATVKQASYAIDRLLTRPRKKMAKLPLPLPVADVPAGPPTVEDTGVFVLASGQIAKLQLNKAKTGLWAARWVEISGERLLDADGKTRVQGEWRFAPELRHQCTPDRRMNLEQAKAFILRYGRCARCSRKLKAADSVERGIGPVCMKHFASIV